MPERAIGKCQTRPLVVIAALLTLSCLAQDPTASDPNQQGRGLLPDTVVGRIIALENGQPGDQNWRSIARPTSRTEVAAFVDRVSVFPQDTISVYGISEDSSITASVFRIGWYAGARARRILDLGEVRAPTSTTCTGSLPTRCTWSKVLSFVLPDTRTPGVYVVKYTNHRGAGGFVPFVVRPLWRSHLLVLLSFNTYQAYNSWGGTSLYRLRDSTTQSFAVTFWRPYTDHVVYSHFMNLDVPLISFLEKWGYPAEYAADVDFHDEPDLGAGSRAVIFSGHGEYWSSAMRDHADMLKASGVGLAFFGANDGYWQVRYADSGTRNAMRTMICYKNYQDPLIIDPRMATVLFRDRHVGRPENGLIGIMHPPTAGVRQFVPLIARATSEPVFAGTGLASGDSTTAIGGWEGDRILDNGATPSDLVVLFEAPFVNRDGTPDVMQTTIYRGGGGGLVFAAGTVAWNTALDPQNVAGKADERLQRLTRNLLAVLLGQPSEQIRGGTW